MLCRLVDEPPLESGWLHEIKWDGYRVLARLNAGDPELWSRRRQDVTERFREVARRLDWAVLTPDCVLDGEVCALDEHGLPRFSLLQRSRGRLVYYVFDLLELEGVPLLERPLRERRRLLEDLIEPDDPVVRLSRTFDDGRALFAAATEQGLEGVISKRAGSPYRPGKRTGDWQKSKARLRQEFVVVGYTRGRGAREALGALVLAVNDAGGLCWVGNCGTGFGRDEIDRLLSRLQPLVREDPPLREIPPELRRASRRVTWVKPVLVCEVSFAEWTADGRLRAPVYLGLRDDKAPEEVRRELPAAAEES
jgi:bifunctional non-homologous end joining protein LigD